MGDGYRCQGRLLSKTQMSKAAETAMQLEDVMQAIARRRRPIMVINASHYKFRTNRPKLKQYMHL